MDLIKLFNIKKSIGHGTIIGRTSDGRYSINMGGRTYIARAAANTGDLYEGSEVLVAETELGLTVLGEVRQRDYYIETIVEVG